MILWRRDEGGLLIISGGRSLKSWDGSDHKGKVRIVLQEIQEKYIWKQKSFTLITFQSLTNDNIILTCLTGKKSTIVDTPCNFQSRTPFLHWKFSFSLGKEEMRLGYISASSSQHVQGSLKVLLVLHCDWSIQEKGMII